MAPYGHDVSDELKAEFLRVKNFGLESECICCAIVQLIMALSCGTVDEPSLRRSLLRGPAAEGLSFERFSSMIYPEELLLKTTVRL